MGERMIAEVDEKRNRARRGWTRNRATRAGLRLGMLGLARWSSLLSETNRAEIGVGGSGGGGVWEGKGKRKVRRGSAGDVVSVRSRTFYQI